jgi:VWFA-related protein
MVRTAGLAVCLPLLVGLLLDARPEGARQQPTFRSAVDIVDVDVSVLDRNRLPVRGLTLADFTVLEEGKPRPIVAFTEVTLPSRVRPPALWMEDVASDVSTNEVAREGRLVVLLMDRSIRMEHMPAVDAFASAAVDQLRPGDLAAVVFSDRGVPQNFTDDRARLLATIRQPFQGLPTGDSGSPAECFCGTCSLEAVTRVAEAVQDVRQRRKMLLVISPSMAVYSANQCGGLLNDLRKKAVRALEASNMTVFGFDPTGLQTLAPSASSAAMGSYRRTVQQQMQRRGNLTVLPDHTGGRLVMDAVRPADRVAEIYRESHSYYVLGFQPGNTAADGRFRNIRVQVNRQDVTLQARRGYYAPGRASVQAPGLAGLSEDLSRAVAGFWPLGSLSVRMAAAPFATADMRSAAVGVVLGVRPGPDLPAASLPNAFPAREVHLLVGAFDRNGRALAHERRTIALPPGPAGDAVPYRVASRLTLKPGRYELRAAVEDPAFAEVGSVFGYVDVPDYVHAPVSLSGLLLQTAGEPRPAGEWLDDLVPVASTERRTFARSETVTGFVRVYQGLSRAAMAGYITAEIRDSNDRVVMRQESRTLPDQFGASRGMDFTVALPMSRLSPGEYLLTIQARHGNESARRDARFTIEPAP